jgi:HK97 family phage major capsid protein
MLLQDAASHYVFQPSYNAGTPDMLLGRPIHTSEYMPALTTTAKGIAFGDFSYYKIALRAGLTAQRLNELYAGNGQVGFRFQMRVDGELALAEAIKYLACK